MEAYNYQHEVIIPNEGLPFKIFLFEGADGKYIRKKHWHRSIELFGVAAGELDCMLNDITYHLNAGEFLIINSNEVHSIYASKPNKTIVLQMSPELFSHYYTKEQFIWFEHNGKDTDKLLMQNLLDLYHLLEQQTIGYEFLMLSKFSELEYLLVKDYRRLEEDDELFKSSKNLRKLGVITDYIKEHYTEDLSLEKLAQIFGYSNVYLSRMFVKYAQINYKDYLQSIRLEHAVKQLLQTEKSIGDIAISNGFPTGKAFSNLFRKRYGVVPNEYRKQYKKLKK